MASAPSEYDPIFNPRSSHFFSGNKDSKQKLDCKNSTKLELDLICKRDNMTYIDIADSQYVQEVDYDGKVNLMSFSEYENYYRKTRGQPQFATLRKPNKIREEIKQSKQRETTPGKKCRMTGPKDIWMRVNSILAFMPVHVVDDKDIDRQILITKNPFKLTHVRIITDEREGSLLIPLDDACNITTSLTGPGDTQQSATLIDTGATVNCMSRELYTSLGYDIKLLNKNIKLNTAVGTAMTVYGYTDPLPLRIAEQLFWTSFVIVESLTAPIILGTCFQRTNDAHIRVREGILELRPTGRKVISRTESYDVKRKPFYGYFQSDHTLAPASGSVLRISLQLNEFMKRKLEGRQVIVLPIDHTLKENEKHLQISRHIATGRVIARINNGTVLAPIFNAHESARKQIKEGQKVAQVRLLLTEYETAVEQTSKDTNDVDPCRGSVVDHNQFLMNINGIEPVQTRVVPETALTEKCYESEHSDGLSSCTDFPATTPGDKPFPTRPTIDHLKDKCTPEQWARLQEVIERHVKNSLFAKTKSEVGLSTIIQHSIEIIPGAKPVRCGLRKMAPDKAQEANRQLKDLIDMGLVEPARSPFASAIVMAKKKGNELRLCIDFRALNEMTIKDAYPLPRIDLTMQKLGIARYFSSLDMGSAFWQIELKECDRFKTAFVTDLGQYMWTRMPFGLCNATATFQRMMARIFESVQQRHGSLVLCYVDDIIIATETLDDHISRLDEVFSLLHGAGLKLKAGKCDLIKDRIVFLGRIIQDGKISMVPEHIEAVKSWEPPRNKKHMQKFLGFTNYYRNFVKNYAAIVHPLQSLIRKDEKYIWTDEHQTAFNILKDRLTQEGPILSLPTDNDLYVLDCDASDVAIAGILHQRRLNEKGELIDYPIAYGSRALQSSEKNYGAAKAEMLAVVYFTDQYRQYLLSRKFLLRVDNQALAWLRRYSTSSTTVSKWIQRLENFHFDIQHIPRTKNVHADALTKKTEYLRAKDEESVQSQMGGFSFLRQQDFDKLEMDEHLDHKGKPIEKRKTEIVANINHILDAMCEDEVEIEPWELDQLEGEIDDVSDSDSESLQDGFAMMGLASVEAPSDCETAPVVEPTKITQEKTMRHQEAWWPMFTVEEDSEPVLSEDITNPQPGINIYRITKQKQAPTQHEDALVKTMLEFVTPQRYTFRQLREAQARDKHTALIIQTIRFPDDREKYVSQMPVYVKRYFNKNEKQFAVNDQGVLIRRDRLPSDDGADPERVDKPAKRSLIVLPQMYYHMVISEAHDRVGHPGQGKTISTITQRFEWPGMDADIRDYVASCPTCQTMKQPHKKKRRMLKSIISNRPNDLLQIDHLCLPTNAAGYKGVLVMIDHFSKYVEVAPCKEMTAKETALLLDSHWFSRHGPPATLQSDNGAQFTSQLMREFLNMNAVIHNLSTPYHPQTNGLVERQNRTMLSFLKGFCVDRQHDWPDYLQKAVFAYNSLVHSTTGVTPNLLFTGSQKAIPLGNLFPDYAPEHRLSASDFIRRQREIAQYYFAVAALNTKANLERQKRNHDSKVGKVEAYKVGDLVQAFVNVVRRKDMRKMTKFWRGPFKISHVISGGWAYRLDNGYRVNHENLRRYMGRPNQFMCDDEGVVILCPDVDEDTEEIALDVNELPERPASDNSLLNENIKPDTKFNMKLRDRSKIRRQFDPDYIQDYYSLISGSSNQDMCMISVDENRIDAKSGTGSSEEVDTIPDGVAPASVLDASEVALRSSHHQPHFDSQFFDSILGASTAASEAKNNKADNESDGSTPTVNPLSQSANTDQQPTQFNLNHLHFCLNQAKQWITTIDNLNHSSVETYLKLYIQDFHNLEYLLVSSAIRHITNLPASPTHTSPDTRTVSLTYNLNNIKIPTCTARTTPTHQNLPKPCPQPDAVEAPTPNVLELNVDIFHLSAPIVLLMSLDLQPNTLFQRETLNCLSYDQLQHVFQRKFNEGDFVYIPSPAKLDCPIVLLFVSVRSADSTSIDVLHKTLTNLVADVGEAQLHTLSFCSFDIRLRKISLNDFWSLCGRIFIHTTINVYNSHRRILT